MRIKVLGPVAVERDGVPVNVGGSQQRRLLALLVLQRGRAVSAERVVDALWPDGDAPDGAARSMRTYLSRLRAVLPGISITTQPGGYVLDADGARVDADEFDGLLGEAESSVPDRALGLYDEALSLWHGDPFGEFADEWWALPESTRLRERRVSADLGRAEARMAMGHYNRAIPDLERLTAERPLDERSVVLLMQALLATGRQAESMRVARAFRKRLREQTGLEPSAQLVRLEAAVATGTDAVPPPVGRPLRGYTLHEAIGEGAHGRVYAATQPGTERLVAVKVIRPDLADSTVFVVRFEAEARLIARLEHPHIVPLYDAWREPGGAFLVFRLLGGGTLRDSIVSGGPWSLPRVSRLVEEVGGALIAAHAAGVIHNDVKSSNVLLDDHGAAYVGDFGIAIAAEGRDADRCIGEAGDVRDFGLLLWEVLTGQRPPVSSLVGRLRPVPDGLDAVLRRATNGGYESVAELVLGWRAAVGDAGDRQTPLRSDERRIVDSARRAAARQLSMTTSAGVNPYRGLRPFDEADTAGFHGRDAAVADLVEHVAANQFVTVVGSSGSGKTSVVLAGVVPRLRSGGDVVVTMLPGDDPVGALQTALTEVATRPACDEPRGGAESLSDVARRLGRVVLVIDQFEECWTRAPGAARDRFVDIVATALQDETVDIRVLATVRADLLDRPLEHPVIGQLVGAGSYVLAPLSPAELDQAIVQPAARVGVGFEDGAVAALIAEAVSSPGSLPLLQFTLTELYDRRVDAEINRQALDDVGGLAGAIGGRAEEVYAGLDAARQAQARALFGRLVAPGDGAPDTRRRARLGDLTESMRAVADEFVAARLLVSDRDPATREPTVEVAHEALLTRWSRLVGWVDEDRRWLAQLQHLSAAARAWDDAGRGDSELYRGVRLEAAIEALDRDAREVTDLERTFVESGRQARDADVVLARRTAQRLRRLLVVVAAALVVALATGAVAVVQRRDAEQARAEASDAAALAEQQRVAADTAADSAEASAREARIEALVGRAEALRDTQRDTAALLAVEAYRLADTPRTRSALLSTFTDQARFHDARRVEGSRGGAGIVMPDGTSAYLVDDAGRLRPYELDTGSVDEPLAALGDTAGGSFTLAASADGRWLAQVWRSQVGDGTSTVGVFDARNGTLTFPPVAVEGTVWAVAFTPEADALALAIDEGARLLVVDRETGSERGTAPGVTVPPIDGNVGMEPQAGDVGPVPRRSSIAGADGLLLLGAADGSMRVLDSTTLDLVRTLDLAEDALASIQPLSDGTLITAGRGGTARVDPGSGEILWQHEQGRSSIGDGASGATCAQLAVVESRGTFYCGNAYGRLAEHDLDSGHAVRLLDAQNGNSGALWPARDGTELVSFADNEPIVSRWRLDDSGPITHLVSPGFRTFGFNPTGDHLIVERGGAFEGIPSNVVDVVSGEVVRTLDGLINADWLDDDTVVGAIINDEGQVETAHVDLPDGEPVADGLIVDPIPNRATIDLGKERTLVVYNDGRDARLNQFDRRTERLGPAIAVDGYVSSAISRSGHRIAAGTERGVEIYDGFTGEQVGAIEGPDLRGVFLTVTDQLFVSSLGGELNQYDLDTLEPVRSFGGSRGFITDLRGTADGTLIATVGGDHEVIIYDVATGVRIGTPITIPDDEHNFISLSLDGRWLAAGGEVADGADAIQVWDLDPAHWSDAACQVAGRNLTPDEWASNIGHLAAYRATCPDLPLNP